jgi:20S proteasome subunit alpha 3
MLLLLEFYQRMVRLTKNL